MKQILIGLTTVLVVLVAFVLWYRWDSGQNRGYEFGYWGSFNRVSNTLARIPGVTIVNSSHNADVTLEEFAFEFRTAEGTNHSIWFMENDPTRSLSGTALADALINKINQGSSSQTSERAVAPL